MYVARLMFGISAHALNYELPSIFAEPEHPPRPLPSQKPRPDQAMEDSPYSSFEHLPIKVV